MTLIQLFTAIANAIRSKKGTQATIAAEDFPDEIADITTGNLTDEEYEEANDDLDEILEGTTLATIYPPDWSEIGYTDTPESIIDYFNYSKNIKDNWDSSQTNLQNKFNQDTTLRFMPVVDTSNATNMDGFVSGCYNLVVFPALDTSNVTTMFSMFLGCEALKNVSLFDTSKVTNMFVMFQNCKSLENVPVLDTSSCTNFLNMFTQCTKLTNESLNNILKMCINATLYTGTKTLKQLGLTAAQATTCQGLSNYQDFLDAGWTTGY